MSPTASLDQGGRHESTGHGASVTAASAAVPRENGNDLLELHAVEIAFHQAGSTKDLNWMMSLFTDDATLAVGGKTYAGKDQVRNYFATVAGAFQPQNRWVGYTPAHRIRINVPG